MLKKFFDKMKEREHENVKKVTKSINESHLAKTLPDGKKVFSMKNPAMPAVLAILAYAIYKKYTETVETNKHPLGKPSAHKFKYSEKDFEK